MYAVADGAVSPTPFLSYCVYMYTTSTAAGQNLVGGEVVAPEASNTAEGLFARPTVQIRGAEVGVRVGVLGLVRACMHARHHQSVVS